MDWITEAKIPVGQWAGDGVDWLTENASWFFDGLADIVNALIDAILWLLQTPHPLVVIAFFAALAWVLHNPVVSAPIVGSTKPHHLSDAVAALDLELTDDELTALEQHYQPRHPTYFR